MSKEKIAVLMGGASLEREVSLRSGKRIADALEALGHKVLALDITPELVDTLRAEAPDCCYIALHGKYGEDGTVQELLEFLDIPYTGSGVVASTLAWDKSVSKYLFRQEDIPTPAWMTLTTAAFKEMGAATALDLLPEQLNGFPLVVKPSEQGSALGLTRVDDAEALPEALLSALSYGDAAMVEQWVEGTELAVSVVGHGEDLQVLPPVEIEAKSGLFDFDAMYTRGATDYYVPARLPKETLASVTAIARDVHDLLGCRDVSRVDLVVGSDGSPSVLECNTSPGMTEVSLLPMAANAADMTFQDVVERLIRSALDRRG